MKKIVKLFLLILCFIFIVANKAIADTELLKAGDTALLFYLQTLKGEEVFLTDYCGKKKNKPQKVILLVFWNTDCKVCMREIPLFNDWYDKYNSKGLEIFLINLREKSPKIEKILESTQVKPAVLLDIYGSVGERYGVKKILPVMFLINKNRIIEYSHTGAMAEKEQEVLIKRIEELL